MTDHSTEDIRELLARAMSDSPEPHPWDDVEQRARQHDAAPPTRRRTGVWLAAAACTIALVGGLVAMVGSDDEPTVRTDIPDATSIPDSTTPSTSTPSSAAESEATDVEEEPDSSDGPLTTVGRYGFSAFEAGNETWASVGAEITNNTSGDLYSVSVAYSFVGADGVTVGTEYSFLDVIPAGESVYAVLLTVHDVTTSALPLSVEITASATRGRGAVSESDWVSMEFGPDVSITQDESSATVAGTVTNPTDRFVMPFRINCLLLTDDGTVVGGFVTFHGGMGPGRTMAWDVTNDPYVDGAIAAGATTAECVSIVTLDG